MLLETARRVELRDPDSGRLLRTMALPPPAADQPWRTQFVGDLLLIRDGGRMVTAYAVGSLSRRWSRPLDPTEEPGLFRCGDFVCLQEESGGLGVLDPMTGRTRWQAIGALPGVVGECQAPGSVLVCRRDGGAFGVWRLDR
ncbi:hypothetical protein ABZ807_17265 [Micromonospora sp. NPDC047548]|uniref:hypothetical protein n=1 Tax=Micromonospora sp. NPDC047548 TaxID=3155624 RepID=UPI0033FC300B